MHGVGGEGGQADGDIFGAETFTYRGRWTAHLFNVHRDFLETEYEGKRIYLTHGDGLAKAIVSWLAARYPKPAE